MWTKGDKPDLLIAETAARQHGVVTRTQLEAAGLVSSGIAVRLEAGRIHRVHRGVYAVGHSSLGNEGVWMAAVLACGRDAVLSHQSAAQLWGIRRRDCRPPEAGGRGDVGAVDVTVPKTSGMRKRCGIALHRSATLTADMCTRRDGIPVTKPARTLADLRPLLSEPQFAAAVREAEFLGFPVGEVFTVDRARTDLEQGFLALCRRHRLPKPEVNVKVERFEVDFLWRDERVIVELDGWESHRTRSAFEEDRARDARLKILGFDVLRFTWRQVTRASGEVAGTIRELLRRSAAA
jgi:very-short-patch-repair endonuclease